MKFITPLCLHRGLKTTYITRRKSSIPSKKPTQSDSKEHLPYCTYLPILHPLIWWYNHVWLLVTTVRPYTRAKETETSKTRRGTETETVIFHVAQSVARVPFYFSHTCSTYTCVLPTHVSLMCMWYMVKTEISSRNECQTWHYEDCYLKIGI